jgi:hypothetical protein
VSRARTGLRMAALGFLGGAALGTLLWSAQMRRSRRELFSRSRVKRFLALGYVGGQTSVDDAQLLRDYVDWETDPVLRHRGRFALRRMEQRLEL